MSTSIRGLTFSEQQMALFVFLKEKIGDQITIIYFLPESSNGAVVTKTGSLSSVGFNEKGLFVTLKEVTQKNHLQQISCEEGDMFQSFSDGENKVEEIGASSSLVYKSNRFEMHII